VSSWFLAIIVLWMLCPVILTAALVTARRAIRASIARDLCVRCGYDLAGLWHEAPRCPECGHSEGGRAAVAARPPVPHQIMEIGGWAAVWWLMLTLTIAGIAFVIVATILGTAASIP
jgi:DNA-directed RNA polymerase subunit RPC12/RpoP